MHIKKGIKKGYILIKDFLPGHYLKMACRNYTTELSGF
jgi:hypothetical protein